MSKLAQKRSVSRSTIGRAVNEDLDMKSYVRRVCNLLTTRSRALRAERWPKLLNHLKHKGEHVRVFVDDKKFVVDEVANKQNTLIIAFDPSEVPPVMQSKNPASVMFLQPLEVMVRWCLLISSKRALKSTQRSSWKFWKMFWCRGYVGTTTPSKWCSPAHGAKKVQDFLKENFP